MFEEWNKVIWVISKVSVKEYVNYVLILDLVTEFTTA